MLGSFSCVYVLYVYPHAFFHFSNWIFVGFSLFILDKTGKDKHLYYIESSNQIAHVCLYNYLVLLWLLSSIYRNDQHANAGHVLLGAYQVSYSSQPAITKYHRRDSLNNTNLHSYGSRGWKSEISTAPWSVSGEGSLSVLIWLFLLFIVSDVRVRWINLPFTLRSPTSADQDPIIMTSLPFSNS